MTSLELREARKSLGLSQQKMAAVIKTTRRTWQDWEYGVTQVPGPVECLIILLLRYKTAVTELLKNRRTK